MTEWIVAKLRNFAMLVFFAGAFAASMGFPKIGVFLVLVAAFLY